MPKESLNYELSTFEAIRASINSRLEGKQPISSRRKEQIILGELSISEADIQALISVGLQVNSEKASLAPEKIHELSELILQVPTAEQPQITEIVQNIIANPSEESFKFKFPRESVFYRIATIILILVVSGALSYSHAFAQMPTVTPTPATETQPKTATPMSTAEEEENQLPTVTPTPRATSVPRATATPEITASPETAVDYAVVNSDGTNLRQGPSTDTAKIGVADAGDRFKMTGEEEQVGTYTWYEVYLEEGSTSQKGWFRGDLITVKTETVPAPVQPSEAITQTQNITATEVVTQGVVDTEAVGGSVSPITYDAFGFPTAEVRDGEVQKIEALSLDQFLKLENINGQELVNELPKQVAFALPDGTISIKSLGQQEINASNFAVTQENVYISLSFGQDQRLVMLWEGGIKYREDWKIPQFEGQKMTLSISSAYNDVHPTREVILKGKKQILLKIYNGNSSEATASVDRRTNYVNNQEYLSWYQEYSFIEQNAEAQQLTPEYDSSVKLDNLITAFWNKLEPYTKDGKVNFPKLGQEVDLNAKVHITIWRFPDDEEGRLGWHSDAVSPLPQAFYQINEKGELIIHLTPARTSSHNLSSVISGAFAEVLLSEFGLQPDYMDIEKPMYEDINNSTFDYVQIAPDQKAIILPVYVDVGEEATGTWDKSQ